MSDKDVQRNVRSNTKEGILTPAQKHFHALAEHDTFLMGERQRTDIAKKKELLEKFKERERRLKGKS
ncbi:MAG: hypothetical protein Q8M92_02025 [Candidatus Subteraquimicrobiales bacterium]|nr:hypothetical protein [Candidatus Subteraquimicrobiales bacterium]